MPNVSSERVRPDAIRRDGRRNGRPPSRPDPVPGRSQRRPVQSSSPFRRLARTHALLGAADAAMAGVLAGSLFFSLSPDAARSKVLLYQIVSVAPFAVIAPLIGPTLDRIPGGRRFVVQITAVVRAVLFIAMAFHVDELLLFPLVFGVMVMQKTYAVSKSALVPLVVRNEQELVEANSKLGLISGLAAAVAVGPLGGLAKISPALALVPGAMLFIAAALTARQLPRDPVATLPVKRAERLELRSPGLILAAGAMVLCRATVGFLLFHLLFWMREDYGLVWLGVALGAFGVGSMLGNLLAPVLRRTMREETMLTGALGTIAIGGVVAAVIGGVGSAVMLAAVVNLSSGVARMAFDSIVQREAPDANQARAFAKFETRFQLAWVLAGVPPVLFTMPGVLGFLVVGGVATFAVVSYLLGARAASSGKPLPPTLTARAKRGVRREVARRRDRREGATPAVGSSRPQQQRPQQQRPPLPPPTSHRDGR